MGRVAFVVYQVVLSLAALAVLPFLFLLRRDELRERLGGGSPSVPGTSIWIHAASLGEFEAALPIIREWAGGPSRILVSCTNRMARTRIAARLPARARGVSPRSI